MAQRTFASPLGTLLASADAEGICSLDFVEEGVVFEDEQEHLTHLQEELDAYFEGRLKHFSVPLHPHGTPFQECVWKTLTQIPYGETISYSEEAICLNHPKATRAVANANGKNKVAILIPCHRVIAKDGTIGGYSGGLWRKKYLLALEQKYR